VHELLGSYLSSYLEWQSVGALLFCVNQSRIDWWAVSFRTERRPTASLMIQALFEPRSFWFHCRELQQQQQQQQPTGIQSDDANRQTIHCFPRATSAAQRTNVNRIVRRLTDVRKEMTGVIDLLELVAGAGWEVSWLSNGAIGSIFREWGGM
jgi:hypothetical protein